MDALGGGAYDLLVGGLRPGAFAESCDADIDDEDPGASLTRHVTLHLDAILDADGSDLESDAGRDGDRQLR